MAESAATPVRPGWRRWRLRAVSLFAVLVSALAVVVAPGTAHAGIFGPDIPCPDDPNIQWVFGGVSRQVAMWVGTRYTVVSAVQTFAVSDARVVDNGLDVPISATYTSQQSRSYTVTATVGTSGQLVDKLQTTVSVAIQASRSTSIGVNATTTVPPHSRVLGQYGVYVYNVSYTGQLIYMNRARTNCEDRGTSSGSTIAPTVTEGWVFSAA